MRKLWMIAVLALCFTGCGAEETFETVADEMVLQTAVAQPGEIQVQLPEEAVLPAMESDNGTLYICRDYEVSVQTLDSGDLEETVRTLSGFESSDLTVMETQTGAVTRYEFVWTSAGEAGDKVCRAAVLDDGNYHYCLSAQIDADLAGSYQEMWNGMFEYFCVS